jgi:tetratricopeptide (TPR) repeat protein
MNRAEFLKNEIILFPDDPFNYYLLGLEYIKLGDTQKVREQFELLLTKFETYLPSYYTYSNYQIQIGAGEEVIQLIEKGIALSRSKNEFKTEKELRQLIELNF